MGDVRTEALTLGRFVLDQLAAERAVVDVFERDGERVGELRDLWRERISDTAYRAMADIIRRWLGPTTMPLEAPAVLLLGSLVNVHRSTWTFGAPPLGLDDDTVLEAWADQCVTVVERLQGCGTRNSPSSSSCRHRVTLADEATEHIAGP